MKQDLLIMKVKNGYMIQEQISRFNISGEDVEDTLVFSTLTSLLAHIKKYFSEDEREHENHTSN